MTQEEKARRYDEALEEAKKWYEVFVAGQNYPATDIKVSYGWIFPELKESESEKIRKAIISFLKSPFVNENITNEKVAPWIAWLENQSNKDSQVKLPTFTFDDILALQCCMETVKKVQMDKDLYEKLNDLHSRLYDAYHLEKQDEQKPYGQREECSDCQFNYAGECKGSCSMKRSEQKSDWSEEDRNFMSDTLSNLIELRERYGEGYGNVGKCIDWLKSLKQRIENKVII